MKSNQIATRMSKEHIEIITKLARAAYMTPAAMLRRLVLERLEALGLIQIPEGEPNENERTHASVLD